MPLLNDDDLITELIFKRLITINIPLGNFSLKHVFVRIFSQLKKFTGSSKMFAIYEILNFIFYLIVLITFHVVFVIIIRMTNTYSVVA